MKDKLIIFLEKIKNSSSNIFLFVIGIGIWVLVLQNAGIIPTKQNVYVKGGFVEIEKPVSIDGEVRVEGSVDIENTVDVNIHEINGYNQVTTGMGRHSVFPYGYMLPVK